ncbi:hypothetical protein HK097_003187, partial [Rhizophlyctis rosea]
MRPNAPIRLRIDDTGTNLSVIGFGGQFPSLAPSLASSPQYRHDLQSWLSKVGELLRSSDELVEQNAVRLLVCSARLASAFEMSQIASHLKANFVIFPEPHLQYPALLPQAFLFPGESSTAKRLAARNALEPLLANIANTQSADNPVERHHIAVAAFALVDSPINEMDHQSSNYCLLPKAFEAHVVFRCADEKVGLETYSAGQKMRNNQDNTTPPSVTTTLTPPQNLSTPPGLDAHANKPYPLSPEPPHTDAATHRRLANSKSLDSLSTIRKEAGERMHVRAASSGGGEWEGVQ